MLINEKGDEVLVDLVDYPYSKQYKQLLHQYEYIPKYPGAKKLNKKKDTSQAAKEAQIDPSVVKKPYNKIDLKQFFNITSDIN